MVRGKKERTIFTKGRTEQYSKSIYTIVKKDGNMYTLSTPFEDRLVYSYTSLLKVEVSEEVKKKYLKEEKVKAKPSTQEVDNEDDGQPLPPPPPPVRRQSARLTSPLPP